MAVEPQRQSATKVKVTTGQQVATAKQAASWRRLWERLLAEKEAKHGEAKNE